MQFVYIYADRFFLNNFLVVQIDTLHSLLALSFYFHFN